MGVIFPKATLVTLPFAMVVGVSVTRGNSCKLVKTSYNTNAAKYFYTNRIVLALNSLSDTVITAPSVNAFRKQLNTVNLENQSINQSIFRVA